MAQSDSQGWRRSRFVFFVRISWRPFFFVLGSCTLVGLKTARRRRPGPDRRKRVFFPLFWMHLGVNAPPRGGPARPGGSEKGDEFSHALNRHFLSFFFLVRHGFGRLSAACRRAGSRRRAAAAEHSPLRAASRATRRGAGAARLPAAAAEPFLP